MCRPHHLLGRWERSMAHAHHTQAHEYEHWLRRFVLTYLFHFIVLLPS